MKVSVKFCILVLFGALLTSGARALPRFSLATGTSCASCHVNPTGGQMRNEFGVAWGDDKLPVTSWRDDDFPLSQKIGENVSFGLDYRSQFLYDKTSSSTSFQAMTASLYGLIRISRKASFYVKQDVINGTYGNGFGGTEAWALLKILPAHGYLKAGSFLPDYGWKFDDHTHYTRGGELGAIGAGKGLIFTPNYKDIGVEAGISPGDFLFTAGCYNGSGNTAPVDMRGEKAWAASATFHQEFQSLNIRAGCSGYGFRSYTMGGVSGGLSAFDSVLTLVGEVDWTHHTLAGTEISSENNQMAVTAELGIQAVHGIWLVGSYDTFDPAQGISDDNQSLSTNSISRVTAGLEFFPVTCIEIRPQLRFITEQPEGTSTQGIVQLHCWF